MRDKNIFLFQLNDMGVPSKSNNKKFICNGINMKLENKIYTQHNGNR